MARWGRQKKVLTDADIRFMAERAAIWGGRREKIIKKYLGVDSPTSFPETAISGKVGRVVTRTGKERQLARVLDVLEKKPFTKKTVRISGEGREDVFVPVSAKERDAIEAGVRAYKKMELVRNRVRDIYKKIISDQAKAAAKTMREPMSALNEKFRQQIQPFHDTVARYVTEIRKLNTALENEKVESERAALREKIRIKKGEFNNYRATSLERFRRESGKFDRVTIANYEAKLRGLNTEIFTAVRNSLAIEDTKTKSNLAEIITDIALEEYRNTLAITRNLIRRVLDDLRQRR